MKRLIILILLMTVLVACGSTKEADKEVKEDSSVKETVVEKDIEEKDEVKKADKEESKNESVKKETNKTTEDKKEPKKKTVEKPSKKPTEKHSEKSEKEEAVKNEKVEAAAENIIWAQNNRDYAMLKSYLGQNITLNEKNNTLKITNVDYPHEAELLNGIKQADLEHRFTHDGGENHIVGFAVTDPEKEMSYTIDLTMRVGKDSWKMLNMQINK